MGKRYYLSLFFVIAAAAALSSCASPSKRADGPHDPGKLPALAVMDLKPLQASAAEAQTAAEIIRGELAARTKSKYRVIERQNLSTILSDMKLDIALGKDVDSAVRVGKLVGAKLMMIGSLSKIDGRYYMAVEVVDVETSEIKSAAAEDVSDFKDIRSAAQKAADKLSAAL